MEFTDLGLRISVAYDDLSDVWPRVQKALDSQLPLRNVTIRGKLGATTVVEELSLLFLTSNDSQIQRLHKYSENPVTWFRKPFVTLILISCEDAEEYKRNFRLQLKAIADIETRSPVSPEPIFVYVKPAGLDPASKGPAKVVELMKKELVSRRRRDCVVRIDPPPALTHSSSPRQQQQQQQQQQNMSIGTLRPGAVPGLEDLISAIQDGVRCTLEARTSAYEEEVRRQLAVRLDPGWSFATLFLIKDSAAVMMESAGLLEEALREYAELEVAYIETADAAAAAAAAAAAGGGLQPKQARRRTSSRALCPYAEDECARLWSSWKEIRRAIQGGGPAAEDASIKQLLFASQARVLLKLHRYSEVLERGLSLVRQVGSDCAQRQAAGELPPLKSEAWAFAACVSLAAAVSSLQAQYGDNTSNNNNRRTEQRHQQGTRGSRALETARSSLSSLDSHAAYSSFLYCGTSGTPTHHKADNDTQRTSIAGDTPTTPELSSSEYDWQLGTLPSDILNSQHQLTPGSLQLYRLLAELYRHARSQLEALGAAAGYLPPRDTSTFGDAIREVESSGQTNVHSVHSVLSAVDMGTPSASSITVGGGVAAQSYSMDGGSSSSPRPSPSTAQPSANIHRQHSFADDDGDDDNDNDVTSGIDIRHTNEADTRDVSFNGDDNSGAAAELTGQMLTVDLTVAAAPHLLKPNNPATTAITDLGHEHHHNLGPLESGALASLQEHGGEESSGSFLQQEDSVGALSMDGTYNSASNDAGFELRSVGPTPLKARSGSSARAGSSALGDNDTNDDEYNEGYQGEVGELDYTQTEGRSGEGNTIDGVTHRQEEEGRRGPLSLSIRTQRASIQGSDSAKSTPRLTGTSPDRPTIMVPDSFLPPTSTTTGLSLSPSGGIDAVPSSDPRMVERILTTPQLTPRGASGSVSAASTPRSWADVATAGPSGGAMSNAVVHWRLREALSSEAAFHSLWLHLTAACAACSQAGRRSRHSALYRCEEADALAVTGQLERAVELYQDICRVAVREGWEEIAVAVFPKLARCQAATSDAGLVHTLITALPFLLSREERTQTEKKGDTVLHATQLLLKVSQSTTSNHHSGALLRQYSGSGGGGGTPLNAFTARNLHHLDPSTGKPTSTTIGGVGVQSSSLTPDAPLDMSGLILSWPLHQQYSRFFGRVTDGNNQQPILVPPSVQLPLSSDSFPILSSSPGSSATRSARQGAIQGAVGDLVVLHIEVANTLPVAIQLRDVVMTLVGMQEVTSTISPRRGGGGGNVLRSQHSLGRAGTTLALPLTAPAGTTGSGNTPVLRTAESGAFHLASPAGSTGTAGTTPSGFGGQFSRQQSHARSTLNGMLDDMTDGGGGASPRFARFAPRWQDVDQLKCPLIKLPPTSASSGEGTNPNERFGMFSISPKGLSSASSSMLGEIELPPGVTILSFLAAPTKAGLYKAVRVDAMLGMLPVKVNVALPPRTASSLLSSLPVPPTPLRQPSHETAVVLAVAAAEPRVSLHPVTSFRDGTIMAGRGQWIGMVIHPKKDTLNHAVLAVAWPTSTTTADAAASPHVDAASSPARGGHRSSRHSSSNAALSSLLSSSGVLTTGLGPRSSQVIVSPNNNSSNKAPSPVLVSSHGTPSKSPRGWASFLSGGQEILLPDWSRASSSTVWWWVDAQELPMPPEVVRVASPAALLASGNTTNGTTADLSSSVWGGNIGNTTTQHHLGGGSGHAMPAAVVDIPVTLEYMSGCGRTHSKVLSLPLKQPFTVSTAARELPGGSILSTFSVSSTHPHSITLMKCVLYPQPGLLVQHAVHEQLGILPLSLPPQGTVAVTFMMKVDPSVAFGDRAAAQARLLQAAKSQPSALQIEYTVSTDCFCNVPALEQQQQQEQQFSASLGRAENETAAAVDGSPTGLLTPNIDLLNALKASSKPSDDITINPTTPNSSNSNAIERCTFQHHCMFELSCLDVEMPGALVLVQLLGPFRAVAGQPVTLCWRLERVNMVEESEEERKKKPVRLIFELMTESEYWRPLGRRSGTVALSPHSGAVATIEATAIPLFTGALPVPSLRLQDVAYQEVGNDGPSGGSGAGGGVGFQQNNVLVSAADGEMF